MNLFTGSTLPRYRLYSWHEYSLSGAHLVPSMPLLSVSSGFGSVTQLCHVGSIFAFALPSLSHAGLPCSCCGLTSVGSVNWAVVGYVSQGAHKTSKEGLERVSKSSTGSVNSNELWDH